MNKQEMLDAIPDFVERHWPKIDPLGRVRTPGRGEAAVAISAFILEVVPEDQDAPTSQ